ncbi:MAG: two-component system, chemotaxis family, CheB/CheR fusion protein [Actinomycetota bacterium]|jgi:diguanylate cyclase (GGDEF)-like protein|nr:two-component system, chemotaxis family, CheB/CheR fusion protein [Actinomycetota bacterium]
MQVALTSGRASRRLYSLITTQVRVLLEQRSVRLATIGFMLVVASAFSLIPTPVGVDSSWMFIVPVAISSIASGLKEGLLTALAASVLCAAYATARTGGLDTTLVFSVVTARFILYGMTAAVLGAFAEAHYSVQSNLRALATIDPLTKVSNVARFYDELGVLEVLATDFAVLVVDLDDLKSLNDRHGHQAGSAAIQAVANCLRRVVRGSDVVARYGGDEFVVILKDADRAGAQIVVNRMREMLAEEKIIYAPGVSLTVSVGVAMFGQDGSTSEELLAAADSAMYTDKRAHKVQARA